MLDRVEQVGVCSERGEERWHSSYRDRGTKDAGETFSVAGLSV